MRRQLFIASMLALILCASAFALPIAQEKLQKACPGDWLAIEHDRLTTFLWVKDKHEGQLVFEEATIPSKDFAALAQNGLQWLRNNAPLSHAHSLYTIDAACGRITEFYSFTRKCFLQMADADNLLRPLLSLAFDPIAPENRKKLGHAPKGDALDRRRIWQPPLTIEGQEIKNANFEAWQSVWPNDGSVLSNKRIELYYPTDTRAPACFPFWIQISGDVGAVRFRVVDSGRCNLVAR